MISKEALATMRERGGTWAAYENVALDSSGAGDLQFLRYGEGCTLMFPTEAFPTDTHVGMGWKYRFKGFVDLKTGKIQRCRCLIRHPETKEERDKVNEAMEYARRVGDGRGMTLTIAQLTGNCLARGEETKT